MQRIDYEKADFEALSKRADELVRNAHLANRGLAMVHVDGSSQFGYRDIARSLYVRVVEPQPPFELAPAVRPE